MFRITSIGLVAAVLSGCSLGPGKLKSGETTEGLALAAVLSESTDKCWQWVASQPRAQAPQWDLAALEKLSATAQAEAIRQLGEAAEMQVVVNALAPAKGAPCEGMMRAMDGYYRYAGDLAASQSAIYQRALGIATAVGAPLAIGKGGQWLLEGLGTVVGPRELNVDGSGHTINTGTRGAAASGGGVSQAASHESIVGRDSATPTKVDTLGSDEAEVSFGSFNPDNSSTSDDAAEPEPADE